MALSKPHPLRTPEIIYPIGWFLLQDDEDGDYVYNKNVANCTKVNSLWRQTMTPLLNVSNAALNPTSGTSLVGYGTSGDLALDALEPTAGSLKISLGSDSLAFNLKYILEPLSRLKQLQLVNGIDVYVDLLLQAICHLTNLKKLTWHCLAKTQSIGAPQPQPDNDNIDNINPTMTTRLLDTVRFQIDSITELTLDCCHWYSNPDLPQLVRFFLSLKSFYIRLSKYGPWYFPSDELSRNL
ncbi:hypothetical protein BGZ74_001000 [Mortierella antarctica]|nr:hypothetical protein BGZ74_001000 [Mortierella antarctica]